MALAKPAAHPIAAAAADQAAAKKPKPAAPPADTLEWPENQALADSSALAYAALFRAWGADYQGGDACKQAEGLGLRCRSARGGLDELRQLNRPAVLLLHDAQDREFSAMLSALDDQTASFVLGAQSRTVALGALAAQWSGQYTLLWRMPPEAHDNIAPGEHGPAVAWLARQLALAQGRATEPGKDPLFDQALLRQVKQFQLAAGLVPDGVVGPQTLMRLTGVADKTAPRLSPSGRGKIGMSYILDALSKSDQQRRRGAAPTLLLGQSAAAAPKRPAPLAYGLLALVLLGAGMAIGWLHPWQRQPVAPAPLVSTAKSPGASQSQAPAARLALAPKPEPELQAQNLASATPVVAAPAPAQVVAPAACASAPARDCGESRARDRVTADRARRPRRPPGCRSKRRRRGSALGSNSRAAPTAPVASVITMAELPVAIQQELPPMSVSVHAYSGKAAERLVDINGHLLHEGEDVAPGLRLEQITPEGMILSYKGYTFRRGVR